MFRAEILRQGGAGFDDKVAQLSLAGFETSSWEWPAAKTDVAFLWSWQRAGEWCHEFVWARLDHVLERGAVPAPQGSDSDGELWDRLVEAAQQEALRRRAPVKYLGLELPRVGEGRFLEPDPSKWPSREDVSKIKLPVTLEWLGVSIPSGEPLRAQSSFTNLVHLGQAIPHCPLGRSAPSHLTFSVQFMDAVADARKPGTRFKGVCFDETDRIEVLSLLPTGPALWSSAVHVRACPLIRP